MGKTFLERNQKQKKEIEELGARIEENREAISKLEGEKSSRDRQIDALAVMTNEKSQLEFSLNEAIEKLEGESHSAKTFLERNQKQKKEIEELGARIEENREAISK